MRQIVLCGAAIAAFGVVVGLVACESSDTPAAGDAGADAAGGNDATTTRPDGGDAGAGDVVAPGDAGDAAIADKHHLLLSYTAGADGELVAFGLDSRSVEGRLAFPKYGATIVDGVPAPLLLESDQDKVQLLDPAMPWKAGATLDVAFAVDGGAATSDPVAAVTVGAKTYVLLYDRNAIDVFDGADGGAPTRIDLSSLVQADDGDGFVDLTDAVYVASTHRLYFAMGNIDLTKVDPVGFYQHCAGTKSTIAAIDTTSDTLVDLSGTGPAGTIALGGTSPIFRGLYLDGGRLVVASAGCNEQNDAGADAGAGPLVGRRVEAVDLGSGAVTTLLDLTDKGFPTEFVFADAHTAFVQFDGETHAWDPAQTTLGAKIDAAPDTFAYDGAGHLVGVKTTYGADGGVSAVNVVSVAVSDGTSTTLGGTPFTTAGGYLSTADLWTSP